MNDDMFPWKRYWCRISGSISYNMRGFINDPQTSSFLSYHSGVVDFKTLNNKSAVILLGEPGSGKTTTILKNIESFKNLTPENENMIIYKNLAEYSNEQRLINELFNSNRINKWKNGDKQLYYFLDSLDECMFNIPTIIPILQNQIKKLKTYKDRLNIRLLCRTAKWPNNFTEFFKSIWNKNNVEVYELIPLREKDVKLAADIKGLNENDFIKEVINKEIQPLASYPITLNFLLDIFQNNNKLPESKKELYNKGCKILCKENNENRVLSNKTGDLSLNKRLALASRIAAFMLFCNKNSVTFNISINNKNVLSISSIEGKKEVTERFEFDFTENDLKEVIQQTALFSLRGKKKYGFVHHSYLEYLAVRYLIVHELSLKQIKDIVISSQETGNMVIPHFYGVVSWLISLDSEIIDYIIENDPKVMLDSDLNNVSVKKRRRVLENLLKQFEKKVIIDTSHNLYFKYHKLHYPGIKKQLIKYIKDQSKPTMVRRVAIDITEACNVKVLQEELYELVSDTKEELHIREQAAHALSEIADENICLRLKNLLENDLSEDKRDQIKGSILIALWPDYLSTKEVFEFITPEKQSNFYGSYASFLKKFGENIKPSNLDKGLKWVKNNSDNDNKDLKEIILFRAWQHLDKDKIMEAFVDAIIPRLNDYKDICPLPTGYRDQTIPKLKEDIRKKLVIKLIENNCENLFVTMSKTQILYYDDLEWIVNYFIENGKSNNSKVWLDVIDRLFKRDNQDHVELIYKSMKRSKEILDKFKIEFQEVRLDSERAQHLKEHNKKIKKLEKNRKKVKENKMDDVTLKNKIRTLLNKYENGRDIEWWIFCRILALNKHNPHRPNILESDITNLNGWKVCDKSMKKKIVKWAKEYILENETCTEKWIGSNNYYEPDMAGYKAFILIKKLNSIFLDNLSPDIWKKWASAIIGHPESSGIEGSDKTYIRLIEQAYQNASNVIIKALSKIIDKENKEQNNLFILRKVENINDNKLNSFLLEKIKNNSLEPKCFYDILQFLIKNNYNKAIEYSKTFLTDFQLSGNNKNYVKYAGLALLNHAEDAGWDCIWPVINKETEFSKELLISFAHDNKMFTTTGNFLGKISLNEIADLYILLCKKFPRNEDPDIDEAHFVSGRENISNFRDNLLKYLKRKGAIKQLQYIKEKMPEDEIIDYYIIEGKEYEREISWSPFSPNEFNSVINEKESEDILQLTPNIWGFGIDLKALYKRIKQFFGNSS